MSVCLEQGVFWLLSGLLVVKDKEQGADSEVQGDDCDCGNKVIVGPPSLKVKTFN